MVEKKNKNHDLEFLFHFFLLNRRVIQCRSLICKHLHNLHLCQQQIHIQNLEGFLKLLDEMHQYLKKVQYILDFLRTLNERFLWQLNQTRLDLYVKMNDILFVRYYETF